MRRARGHHPPPAAPAAAPAHPPHHRAIRRLAPSPVQLGSAVGLAVAFDAATWSLRSRIAAGWTAFFRFWVGTLELGGSVSAGGEGGRWLDAAVPTLEIAARAPDRGQWWGTLAVTSAVLLGTRLLPERLLPIRYFARFICIVQGSALLFFLLAGDAFPYTLAGYSRSMGQSLLWLMMIVPWLHALTYGIFAFSASRKLALTALTLAFVGIAGPFLLMAHAYLIARLSLLVLPVLYFVFGLPLLVLACIGLYGWAMSWEHQEAVGPAPEGARPE